MSNLRTKVENALNEARVLVLGLQVLLGFQFRAFFEHGWARLPPIDRACAAATLAVFYAAWFGAMLLLRRRSPPLREGQA